MKLTHAQIITLQAALNSAAEKHEERASFSKGTFWAEEATICRELHALFDNACSVEVESCHIEVAPTLIVENDKAEIPAALTEVIAAAPQRQTPPPELVLFIDNSTTRDQAREIYNGSSLKQRRAAAKHLGVPVKCGLYIALMTRFSDRIRAAA